MVQVQSINNNGTQATIYCVMYADAADLKADGVLDSNMGTITCAPGSWAWQAGAKNGKQYDGAQWVDA